MSNFALHRVILLLTKVYLFNGEIVERRIKRGLLISTYRGREDECSSEIWYALNEIGIEESDIRKLPLPGLLLTYIDLDPLEALEKLRSLIKERPWDFRYMLKIKPLERVFRSSLDVLEETVKELSQKIGEDKTFRVTVNKRGSQLSTREIIERAAKHVNRKVDLNNPDYVVLIEVVGNLMGVSVITPDQIVSIKKIKDEELKSLTEESQ